MLCPVSLAALGAGKHVLAEKPVGLNELEAATIEAEAARAAVRFMAGYCLRFSLARHVHDLLVAGVVGEYPGGHGRVRLAADEPRLGRLF